MAQSSDKWLHHSGRVAHIFRNGGVFESEYPLTILLAGLTGIEAVFLSYEANKITGYAPSAYQRQSGLFLLGLTFTALIVYVFGWDLTASLAVMLNLILFLAFSSINHLYSAFYENNKSFRNLWLRGLGAWLMIGALIPLLLRIWVASHS